MRYGHFDDEKNEYVIERPDTPASWVNYLGTDDYCAIVSNNASGYGFHKSPKTGRMLRFRFNSVPTDRPGRYFYLRDAEDGDIWSVTWQPVAKPFRTPGKPLAPGEADYQCAHAPGTTRFTCSYKGIEAELRAFVPRGESAEVWSLVLKNGDTPRTLDLFGYVEWCFWHIQQDAMNFQYILYTCRMGEEDGIIDYSLRLWPMEEPKAYFASTEKVDSFDTDRDVFLGNYRHEGQPIAVETGRCKNSIAVGGTPCGALHHRLTLAPGECRTVTFIAGVGDAKLEGKRLKAHYSRPGAVDEALAEIAAYWDDRLGAFSLSTPDAAVNSMGNIWNQVRPSSGPARPPSMKRAGAMGWGSATRARTSWVCSTPLPIRYALGLCNCCGRSIPSARPCTTSNHSPGLRARTTSLSRTSRMIIFGFCS
jgi:N,N'-diacetylchitobiose phosphorylase